MQKALDHYLRLAFGTNPALEAVPMPKSLPILYSATFQLLKGTVEQCPCLFAVNRGRTHLTPARIKKQISTLTDMFQLPVAYVGTLTHAHEPERMIAMRIPFVIPGKHLYLPFIGTLLSLPQKRIAIQRDYLSVCAQLIVTGVLLKQIATPVHIADVVEKLPFSRSSVISALNELEYFKLGQKEKLPQSREIELHFYHSGQTLWEDAQQLFRNPCKRTVGLHTLPEGIAPISAGADALAEVSMLSEQPPSIYAMELSSFRKLDFEVLPLNDADIKMQLWLYQPDIFGNGKIDPLSLALSLTNDPDDRVQIALEEYMKGFSW